MKVNEFRGLSTEDLLQKEKAFKKDLFELNYQRKLSRVEKPHRFKQLKKDIARIQTIIKERDLEDERNSKENK